MNVDMNESAEISDWDIEILDWLLMDQEPLCMLIRNAIIDQPKDKQDQYRELVLENVGEALEKGDAVLRCRHTCMESNCRSMWTEAVRRHRATAIALYYPADPTDHFHERCGGDVTVCLTEQGRRLLSRVRNERPGQARGKV